MKLSVVIPAYNESECIEQCLRSVIRETHNVDCTVEIIVVNNASTDTTAEQISKFSEVKLVQEPVKGLVHARKRGLEEATGHLIANIDADIIMPLGWMQRVIDEFRKDPKLVALSGPCIFYDLPHRITLLVRGFYIIGYVTYLFNRYVLRMASLIQGGNFVVQHSALDAIGGYNTKTFEFYGEDADIARRLTKLGHVKFTFALPMYTSGRRLIKEGIVTMGFKYAANYLWTVFFRKPFTKTYEDHRTGS